MRVIAFEFSLYEKRISNLLFASDHKTTFYQVLIFASYMAGDTFMIYDKDITEGGRNLASRTEPLA